MDESQEKTLPAAFYRTASGTESGSGDCMRKTGASSAKISAPLNLAGQSGCRCVARWVAAYLRSAARSRKSGFPAYCSAFTETK